MRTDILIVGGGLTGLALAARLQEAGADWRLIEARARLGGRILSRAAAEGGPRFDLGPAWFWPGQPRIAALLRSLGLKAFPQHAQGRMALQESDGSVRRDLPMAMMGDAFRIEGGAAALAEGLAARLPPERLRFGAPLQALRRNADGVDATLGPEGETLAARRVALALPPRLAARIAFDPAPSAPFLSALAATPTWMAGQAKLLAVYARPFWREAGLNGDAISRLGPLAEIHDASPADLSAGALFGFVGPPAAARARDPQGLEQAALRQLSAIFGPEAAAPRRVFLQDWAGEPETAAPQDLRAAPGHPLYGPPPTPDAPWRGRLLTLSSEASRESGGLLEGALEAAETAAAALGVQEKAA